MPNASFTTAFNGLGGYREGIECIGEKKTPRCLKTGCLGLLTVPIIGVGWTIINEALIKGAGREHIPMYCGASLGLIVFGSLAFLKSLIKKLN